MQSPIPEARAAEADQLSAEVEKFLASGQSIVHVPGFKHKPIRPVRIPPDPAQALLGQLRAMARRGCSKRYTAMCLGITPGAAYELARKNGIKFRGSL